MRSFIFVFLLSIFGVFSSASAQSTEAEFSEFETEFDAELSLAPPADPISGLNRGIYVFNDKLYFWVMKPAAKGYESVAPESSRVCVSNFFDNLGFPRRFVNNLLQLKFKGAGVEISRFTINTTVGVIGLWDRADDWCDLEEYDEDFGQTLGHYGLGSMMAIHLPFIGSSNLRDTIGLIPDTLLDPVSLIDSTGTRICVRFYNSVNGLSLNPNVYESLKQEALDPYIFFRDAYEQKRNKEIEE